MYRSPLGTVKVGKIDLASLIAPSAAKMTPHCRIFDWQTTVAACRRARWTVGTRIAMSIAMIEITTSNSMSANAFLVCMVQPPLI
jgi:hypothetical protein